MRPHLLRNQWNEFAPNEERRAKFCEEVQRLAPDATVFDDWWLVCQAAMRAGYTSRHARRLAERNWTPQEPEK